MKIAVVGSGLMGSALGRLWAGRGHDVTFSYSHSFDKLEGLAREAGHGAKAARTPAEAIADADIVLFAILWRTLDDVLAQSGDLSGKILISNSLPMTDDDSDLVVGHTTSGGEILAQRTGARVTEAFNTIWSDVLTTPSRDFNGITPSMFYCGDDAQAKQVTASLIHDAGFDPIDIGGLVEARLLEPFGLLGGKLGARISPQIAYKLLRR